MDEIIGYGLLALCGVAVFAFVMALAQCRRN